MVNTHVNCSLPREVRYSRYEVYTTVKIQVGVFWVVTPCSVSVRYQRFFKVKMEAARSYTTPLHGVRTQKIST
jgi:hypothetical protein